MNELPAPPVPAGLNLKDMDGFLLNVERLLASELWALSSGEEFKAALGLWCRAWKQVPAASLPDDDRVLAQFSGAGKRWPRVRDVAMRGFVLCSDGRLYHLVLAADAMRAANKRDTYRARAVIAANARWKDSPPDASSMPQACGMHPTSSAKAMPADAQYQYQYQIQKKGGGGLTREGVTPDSTTTTILISGKDLDPAPDPAPADRLAPLIALGVETHRDLPAWLRDTDGLSAAQVAAIAATRSNPIRWPSDFRPLRAAHADAAADIQRERDRESRAKHRVPEAPRTPPETREQGAARRHDDRERRLRGDLNPFELALLKNPRKRLDAGGNIVDANASNALETAADLQVLGV